MKEKRISFLCTKKAGFIAEPINVFFPDQFWICLEEYLSTKNITPDGFLFSKDNNPLPESTARSWYYRAWKLASSGQTFLPKSLTHSTLRFLLKRLISYLGLRASRITQLFAQNVGMQEVVKLTGHSGPDAAMYYDRSNDDTNISKRIQIVPLS